MFGHHPMIPKILSKDLNTLKLDKYLEKFVNLQNDQIVLRMHQTHVTTILILLL